MGQFIELFIISDGTVCGGQKSLLYMKLDKLQEDGQKALQDFEKATSGSFVYDIEYDTDELYKDYAIDIEFNEDGLSDCEDD